MTLFSQIQFYHLLLPEDSVCIFSLLVPVIIPSVSFCNFIPMIPCDWSAILLYLQIQYQISLSFALQSHSSHSYFNWHCCISSNTLLCTSVKFICNFLLTILRLGTSFSSSKHTVLVLTRRFFLILWSKLNARFWLILPLYCISHLSILAPLLDFIHPTFHFYFYHFQSFCSLCLFSFSFFSYFSVSLVSD